MSRDIIAILQPVYLPWMGYFEQMALADHFVFLDDVQYNPRDWRNRNRIKTAGGPLWLTVPVKKAPRGTLIRDVVIDYDYDWRRRHLRSLAINYGKCAHFEPLYSELEEELAKGPRTLLELDVRLTQLLCRRLGIDTEPSYASDVPRAGLSHDKNDRILEICRHLGANVLYDGAKAADFIDRHRFRESGVDVVFQSYQHPRYPQRFGAFSSHMSVVDLIMNRGPESASIILSSPRPSFSFEPVRITSRDLKGRSMSRG